MASNTDKFKKASRRFTTAVGAGGISDDVVDGFILVSTSGLPTDTAIEVVIDRVDASGEFTPDKEEVIVGLVCGSNLVNCLRGVEGTAQAHSPGAVVEVRLTSNQWNDVMDGILTEHNQDGTHEVNLTAEHNADGTHKDSMILEVMDALNPVGTIREFNIATNPGTLLGFGTWSLHGVGRNTVCIDSSDTSFDTVDETGGAKTVNLTHNHTASSSGEGNHRHYYSGTTSDSDNEDKAGGSGSCAKDNHDHTYSGVTSDSGAHGHTITVNNHTNSSQSILSPYIVVYRWVRTA